jgi:exopolysaccharide biosynthesis WecB/TagA/CpsF family protein/anti-anti-sigma factor
MSSETIVILGIPIDNLNMDETVERIFKMIDDYGTDGRPRQVATVNVDFVVNTLTWSLGRIRHPELIDILRRADLVTADGMPIVWTSRLLGTPLKERVTGADLVPRLAEEAARRNKSIFFLGGRGDIGKRAAEVLKRRYPDLKVAGVESPFVYIEGEALADTEEEDKVIVDQINRSGADILLIAFGNPKQEVWFDRNRYRLKVPVSIGIGGTFEFIVGTVSRAPIWMQKTGLEWVYRITQDPGRLWKRYLVGFFKFGVMIWPAVMYYRYKRFILGLSSRRDTDGAIKSTAALTSAERSIKVLALPARLDAASVETIRRETGDDTALKSSNIVLDFSGVSFIDSSGFGFLIGLWRRLNSEGKGIYLMGITPPVEKFLRFNRTWDLFSERICKNLNETLTLLEEKGHLPPFYYIVEPGEGYILLALYGRLDAAQVSGLNFTDITREIGNNDCIINLTELSFVDSSGLGFFFKIQRHLAGIGKKCLLYGLTDNVKQLFRITKLDNLFTICQDLPSARKMLEKV